MNNPHRAETVIPIRKAISRFTMQATIEISDELLTQAIRLADRERTTLNRLIEDALAIRLRTGTQPRRPALPVYERQGGLATAVADALAHRALLDAADGIENP
jgi:hypothetical protein